MIMWQRFKASFSSREHLRDWILAVVAAVFMAVCVAALLLGWFLL
jgi:succinate dehydrogenase hydrophobic anchor subunit